MINYLTTEKNWQNQLNDLITDPRELLSLLQLPIDLLPDAIAASQDFGLRVPRSFVDRMVIGDAHDPLLLQVLPLHAELDQRPQYTLDPLGEKQANAIPGILHKYKKRSTTATTSNSVPIRPCSAIALNTSLPILPKPLIAIFFISLFLLKMY